MSGCIVHLKSICLRKIHRNALITILLMQPSRMFVLIRWLICQVSFKGKCKYCLEEVYPSIPRLRKRKAIKCWDRFTFLSLQLKHQKQVDFATLYTKTSFMKEIKNRKKIIFSKITIVSSNIWINNVLAPYKTLLFVFWNKTFKYVYQLFMPHLPHLPCTP